MKLLSYILVFAVIANLGFAKRLRKEITLWVESKHWSTEEMKITGFGGGSVLVQKPSKPKRGMVIILDYSLKLN